MIKFSRDHLWIDTGTSPATVGITDFAQKQLGDVVYIELPAVGTMLKQHQSFGTVESVKSVSELYAPVTGEVVEVNDAVKRKPELVNADARGVWLIAVTITNPADTDGLLDEAQYADLIR